MPSRQEAEWRNGRDGRTKGNRYKNGLDFIITLVVVNSHSIILATSSLMQIDTSYSIYNRIGLSYQRLTPITLFHLIARQLPRGLLRHSVSP